MSPGMTTSSTHAAAHQQYPQKNTLAQRPQIEAIFYQEVIKRRDRFEMGTPNSIAMAKSLLITIKNSYFWQIRLVVCVYLEAAATEYIPIKKRHFIAWAETPFLPLLSSSKKR